MSADLTPQECRATLAALYDYLSQTEHYLRSYGPDTTHAECCDVAQARAATRREQQLALQCRLAEITSAISKLEQPR